MKDNGRGGGRERGGECEERGGKMNLTLLVNNDLVIVVARHDFLHGITVFCSIYIMTLKMR